MATAGTSSTDANLPLLDYVKLVRGSFNRKTHNISAIVSTMKTKVTGANAQTLQDQCYIHESWVVASTREGKTHLDSLSECEVKTDYFDTAPVAKKNFYGANPESAQREKLTTVNFPVSRFLTDAQVHAKFSAKVRATKIDFPRNMDNIHSGVFTLTKMKNKTTGAYFFEPYTEAMLPYDTLPRLVCGLAAEFKVKEVTVIRGSQESGNNCLDLCMNYIYSLLMGSLELTEEMGHQMPVKKYY